VTEDEQSEQFARALDQFLFGRAGDPPKELDACDLDSLFDVARRRVDTAESRRHHSREYEAAAWENLIARLDSEDESGAEEDSAWDRAGQMGGVISMRKRLSDDAMSIAELHREDVWRRLQERLAAAAARPGPEAEDDGDSTPGDQHLDSLVRISLASSPVRPRDPEMTQRLWARVGGIPEDSQIKAFDAEWDEIQVPRSFIAGAIGIAAAFAAFIAVAALIPA
jgi:hypothetical protein